MGFIFNPFEGNFDFQRQGSASSNIWSGFSGTIAASQSQSIDIRSLASFSRADYILNFKLATGQTKSMKLVVQNNSGLLTDLISERMGESLAISVNSTDDSVDMFIEVANNEAVSLTFTGVVAIL